MKQREKNNWSPVPEHSESNGHGGNANTPKSIYFHRIFGTRELILVCKSTKTDMVNNI